MMCLVAIASTAQGISGRVIDEQVQPMPFANVVLVSRADSAFIAGTMTKDDGTFSISTGKQDGLLKVTSVEYITRYIDARQGSVGDIQMLPDTQMLGEVVVKGSRPQYKMGNEGLVTNVENTLLSQLGTASDVLKHVPGIIAKDDQYEVFGKRIYDLMPDKITLVKYSGSIPADSVVDTTDPGSGSGSDSGSDSGSGSSGSGGSTGGGSDTGGEDYYE